MSRARSAVAAAALLAVGCASIEEPQPAREPAPVAPPAAVVKPQPPLVVSPRPARPVPVEPAPAPEARANEVETLVSEFARLRRLPAAELAREQEQARQAFAQSRTDAGRVKLAMSIAIPGAPGSDEARALDLLDPLVKTPSASLHALAVLMAAYIQEQRRLGAQVTGLQQNVQGLQQNVHGLQQKLDAITKLERSLTGRGEGGTVRRR